jgi:intraflagellar transport protein 20
MEERNLITFDDEFRVRVLDADKYSASVRLQENCATFDTKVDQLKDASKKYITMLENVAKNIEAEKLRAIGLRNRVGALREQRNLASQEMDNKKQALHKQLDALTQEEQSLKLVIEEQQAQINRLKGQSVAR